MAESWFASVAGQGLLASETGCVSDALCQRPGQAALWLGPQAMCSLACAEAGESLRLSRGLAGEFAGTLRCGLPLPLASESCAMVVLQHVLDEEAAGDGPLLLEECARILVPGGRLWLLALNPFSPYRWRWHGHGLRAREPVTWRKRLRVAGLTAEPVAQGVGPLWDIAAAVGEQDGAGLRAAYLLRAEKRRQPMTPVRQPRAIGWQTGTQA